MAKAKKNENEQEPIEKQLWKSADKLRKNIDAAEYKHIVLGLIFLKYISYAFEELHNKLKEGKGEYQGADPEDKDEYKAENVFFVPEKARWSYLQSKAKLPEIGKFVDNAMDIIEKDNPTLKDVLPKVFARGNLDPTNLGGLIDLIGNIALGDAKARSADVLGHVFEYFLGEFALAEGKKGGQFYTPRSVVELLVEMLEPYKGRVFDPCCASGGMFVQSEKFVADHQGKVSDISIYGQESNQTTWRLAKMNLAIRGIDSSQVKWNNEGSFLNDAHRDLKADYVIANPPFNDSDWSGDLLRKDGRWKYGTPPTGRTRELSQEDIQKIAGTYHNWRNPNGSYEDIKGFCNSASVARVRELDYVLTPGRYVGLPDDEDDFNFNERWTKLKAEFEEQLKEEEKLNVLILKNLAKVEVKNG
ncbi:MAG: SAM-dependent DNA methyltransferase [Desulfobacterales bacterium]|nr:SAM-dependent DNA methyltransferase [Desulfobacterales bacterium]